MSSVFWTNLLKVGGEELEHHLWHAAIIAVAEVHVRRRAGQSKYSSASPDEEESEVVHEVIHGWFSESLPNDHAVFHKARNPDYFREGHVSWDDGMCLAGTACGDVESTCWALRQPPSDLFDARDDVTEAEVEDFFERWRGNFLSRVQKEAKKLSNAPTQ